MRPTCRRSLLACSAASARGAARGLALVEVLTVVCVIVLLLGLLLPALASAREASRAAACQANLRQIGLLVAAYAGDHKGKHRPNRPNWVEWFFTSGRERGARTLLQGDDKAAYWGVAYAEYVMDPLPTSAFDPSVGVSRAFREPSAWDLFRCPSAAWVIPQDDARVWEDRVINGLDGPVFDEVLQWSTYGHNAHSMLSFEDAARHPGMLYRRLTAEQAAERPLMLPRYGRMAPRAGEVWRPARLDAVTHPASLVLAQDSAENVMDGNGDTLDALNQEYWVKAFGDDRWIREYFRHNGAASILWVDGHVSAHADGQEAKATWYTGHARRTREGSDTDGMLRERRAETRER